MFGPKGQHRRRAFPIAANRSAASFNPAYVRSPPKALHRRTSDLT
jgi:hypothetical protein